MNHPVRGRFRSKSVKALSLLAIGALVSACGSGGDAGAAEDVEKVIVYGTLSMEPLFQGDLGDRLREQGVEVQYEAMLTSEIFTKVLATRNNPEASLVFVDSTNFPRGQEVGLWEDLDPELLPNTESLADGAKPSDLGNQGTGVYSHTLVFQYRKDILEDAGIEPPSTFEDLKDPALKGRVGLTSLTSVAGPWELISFAWDNGGDYKDIEPGFEFANELASSGQVAYYGSNASDITQALQQEEIWVAAQYGPGAFQAASNDPTMGFSYIEDRTPIQATTMAIPADADNSEAGHIIMNEIASEETQEEFASEIFQVPVREGMDRPEVVPGDDELEKGRISITQLEEITGSKISDLEWGYIGEQSDRWTQRWNEEIESQ